VTPRKPDYQERKDRILSIVVDEYVQSISPVSSQFITEEYFPDLSSATIRNILSELEEEGYLTHPHTSAGRIPTQNGYRYYVDHLMDELKLLEAEKNRIQSEYTKKMRELEAILTKTSEVISNMTHYTSIISVDGRTDKIFCRGTSFVAEFPEFHDFVRIRYILSMLEEKDRLLEVINRNLERKIGIFIGQEIACADIDNCSLVVSCYSKKGGPSGRLAVLGPTRMDYERVVSTLDYFSDLISEMV